ncbi:MAG: autotransporter-associated beta strand repeat-containing protein [Luteolibacter sp.]|uniref:beta strand repeat-containing protein n=1 Tax=Luteolibacter sp. TaxID=1962973 RepID=UPI003264265A
MNTQISTTRDSLTNPTARHANLWFARLIAGAGMLGSSSVQAATWRTTAATTEWNTFSNWSGTTGGSGPVIVNSIPANVATITANINPIPDNISVGFTAAGRVNHLSGNASVAAGNDLVLGYQAGGNGTYNLANTAGTGGSLTGFGQGSGNVTIPNRVSIGGFLASATGTMNIHTSGTFSVGTQLLVGNLGGAGTVKMDSGTLTVANDMEIGNGANSTGTFSMSGGTVTKSSAATAVTIGGGLTTDGGTGTANLNGGTFTAAGNFRVGHNLNSPSVPHSNGTLNLGGTNLTVNGEFWVANNTGATGTLNFTSGSITVNNWSLIGRKDDANTGVGAIGTVTMSGGTWTKNGESNFVVGDTGAGTMNMSGGLVIVTPHATADRGVTWIGNRNNATGSLTISGTAEFRSSRFVLGVEGGTAGTLNLTGGTLKTSGLVGGGGTSTVSFDGTQIIATADSGAYVDSLTSATLNSGGLRVDTAGFTLTAPQALVGSGGVIKTGAGTLSLTGANTYTGNHTVSAGKLAVSTDSFGIGNFTVAAGAGMGVIQNSGSATLAVAQVTLGTTGTSSLDIDLGSIPNSPSSPALNVTQTFTINGSVKINVAAQSPVVGAAFPLIHYATPKVGTGTITLGTLPNGVSATLTDDNNGLISLQITAINFPKWTGAQSGVWNTTTENWQDILSAASLVYSNPLPVVFNDDLTGSSAVTLNETVTPSAVKFSNFTAAYSLTGIGKISGTTGLTKEGSADLSLGTVNDYTGVTTLTGGKTTVGTLTNGGVASSLGAASAAAANLVLNGGSLEYTGSNVTIDRGLTINSSGGGISNTNGLTLTGTVVGIPGGSFAKNGAGLLSLAGASVTLGGVGQNNDILGGTLAFTGPGQTASIPGALYVGSAQNVPGNLLIQNSNLTVGGYITVGRGNGNTGTVSTLTATGSVIQVANFNSGNDSGFANDCDQTITLTNTNMTNNGFTTLAESQNSTTNMTLGGTSVYTASNRMQLALNNSAVCNLTIQDTASLVANGGWFSAGNDGTCTLTVKNNGNITTGNIDFNISDVGTSTGTFNIQDNATVSATGIIFVGKNTGTTGTLNMTGGTLNCATWMTSGRYVGGTGYFNLSAGTVNQTGTGAGFIVGENGTATLTVSGTGTLNIDGGGLYLSAEGRGTSHSVANLNGGTIIAKRVVQRDLNPANYTEFRFNGGILRAHTGASLDFMSDHDLVSVDAGGAFIDSNAQTITIAQALTGSGGLTKQGAGTLTLSGTNTYTGPTTVSAGTLSLSTAFLSNTATVTIASGAVLNLPYVGTDTVAGLTINGTALAIGTYNSSTHPGAISGTGQIQVTGVVDTYATWASSYGLNPLTDGARSFDKDGDGQINGVEFALGGSPISGSNNAKVFQLVTDSNDVGTEKELLMTIAVRSGTPVFTGSPSPTATQEGATYTVQGSTSLSGFSTAATVVGVMPPPAPNATAPSGYEWRTFSLSGSNGTPNKGFLRVMVNQ